MPANLPETSNSSVILTSPPHKKWKFYLFLVGLLILLGGGVFFFLRSTYQRSLPANLNQTISPDILQLTTPIITVNGLIEKTDAKTITLSYETGSAASPATPDGKSPSKSATKINFKINITPQTVIFQPFNQTIPFLFKTSIKPDGRQLKINDLKAGQTVTVTSKDDLRQIPSREFTAAVIALPAITNSFRGKIEAVNSNILVIQTPSGAPAGSKSEPEFKKYSVTTNKETELSRPVFSSGPAALTQGEKLTLSDFKPGMDVLVYSDTDIRTQSNLIALKIEPISSPSATFNVG